MLGVDNPRGFLKFRPGFVIQEYLHHRGAGIQSGVNKDETVYFETFKVSHEQDFFYLGAHLCRRGVILMF